VNGRGRRVWLALMLVAALPAPHAAAQAKQWVPAQCNLKAGHYLVSGAVVYLEKATESQFADQRERELRDALRVLTQALTSGGQQKNPAAWYYLGRYYVETNDAMGADSAFTKAVALAPRCEPDVATWRRTLWVPIVNAGIAAWQARHTDSAMAAFRRANQIYAGEPMGFDYLATLLANANQPDSAAKYFTLAIQAAHDPKFAKEKRDAMFNLARVYHAAQRWDDAARAYQAYLAAYPDDVQATAGLASVYTAMGRRDDAKALYAKLFQHADSADARDLFRAGEEILSAVANTPDTAKLRRECRASAAPGTERRTTAHCDSLAAKAIREFDASAADDYRLAERAFEAGLRKNPYYREALFRLAGAATLGGDTATALAAARRLYAVDPLNRSTLRMVAQAWQLKGNTDSTLRYLRLTDSLPVEVTVTDFTTDEQGATVKGLLTNGHATPSRPVALTFEFLNAQGAVVATATETVDAVAPSGNQAFELKASGAGIVAWRYRRSA
jgi:tetratricopeptide (TPR) repeat protein